MVTPKTYVGYDHEGKQVCSCTAEDANNYLNQAEVQKAIENVEDVVTEQMKVISHALQDVAVDAESAIIVQGTKMTQTIEDTCIALNSLPEQFVSTISSLYDEAVSAHDKLQQQANSDAETKVRSTVGVESVS